MQTVQTRFLPATDSRGARIKAFSEAWPRGVTVAFQFLGHEREHATAVLAFLKARGWHGLWVGGGAADQRGEVYVCLQRAHTPAQVRQCRRLFDELTSDALDLALDTGGDGQARFCDDSTPVLLYLPPEET